MTGDLSFLADRGWRVHSFRSEPDWVVSLDRSPHRDGDPAVDVMHRDLGVAEHMATVAALVADGHDVLGVLRDAYTVLPHGDVRSRVLGCLLATSPEEQAA